jgi:chromosome partitioning protein
LVCSQKGGVGKTTTAISLAGATALSGTRVLLLDADPLSNIGLALNLLEHPQRQSLRDAGIDLPGVLVSNVVPGVDVLSPYDEGGCTDDDLDNMLALLGTSALEEHYGCVMVDSPPFMGPNPGQLISSCDEFLLVMRAEAMAYRTLPAFLELMQRNKVASKQPIKMRGILLTLPEGEEIGARWERELRGRLGSRVLPQVVPYDDAVAQASLAYQVVSHASVQGPAAEAYRSVAEMLDLASAHSKDHVERVSTVSALQLAFSQSKSTQRKSAAALRAASLTKPAKTPSSRPRTVPAPVAPARPVTPTVRRPEPLTPAASVPVYAPPPPAAPLAPTPRGVRPVAPRPVAPPPVAEPVADPVANNGFPVWLAVLCALIAVGAGIGLRFAPLDLLLPITVGIVVGAIVLLALRMGSNKEANPATPPTVPTAPVAPVAPTTPGVDRPSSARRLSGLKRRLKMSGRDPRSN